MKRCGDCRHAIMTTDEDDETSGECGIAMPFWVPLPIADYGRWVMPDDGAKCGAFSATTKRKLEQSLPKVDCPKCGGAGWLWWRELDEYYGPALKGGFDDTRYSCDHECHNKVG